MLLLFILKSLLLMSSHHIVAQSIRMLLTKPCSNELLHASMMQYGRGTSQLASIGLHPCTTKHKLANNKGSPIGCTVKHCTTIATVD